MLTISSKSIILNVTCITPTIYPPVIKIPVDRASPIGKVSSHPKSKLNGSIGVVQKPSKTIANN